MKVVYLHCGSSELRSYIKWVEDCLVRVLFTNSALAERTMNSKFSLLHSAPTALRSIEFFSFILLLLITIFENVCHGISGICGKI